MGDRPPRFLDDFRRFFFRGLGALVPTLLTIAILVWAYALVNDYVGAVVTRGLILVCKSIRAEPAPGFVNINNDPLQYGTTIDEWNDQGRRLTIEHIVIHHKALSSDDPDVRRLAENARSNALWQIAFRKYRLHVLGFLIAIILVYFTGFFLASFIGRTVWRAGEKLLYRIPIVKAIYPHVKQVTDFMLAERKQFQVHGVVAVQYPRKGIWSIGLATGSALPSLQDMTDDEMITIFIPSSPTPITGYVIQTPKSEVVELGISFEEALRFTVSGGVIKPGSHLFSGPSEDG